MKCLKKAGHVLLRRLIVLTQCRQPFTERVERYRHQRQWLIELEYLLDPEHELPKTSAGVAQAVDSYLKYLLTRTAEDVDDQPVAIHIRQVFRNFWWGLFACYDVEGLPRTNNELEGFIRQIKMGYRRISGRKKVHDFAIRSGAYAALIEPAESLDELLLRLEEVDQLEFVKEHRRLRLTLLEEVKIAAKPFTQQTRISALQTYGGMPLIRQPASLGARGIHPITAIMRWAGTCGVIRRARM